MHILILDKVAKIIQWKQVHYLKQMVLELNIHMQRKRKSEGRQSRTYTLYKNELKMQHRTKGKMQDYKNFPNIF